jgi:transcriptional regulator with XRE-family HTH domain
VFYDRFAYLCSQKGVSPSRAAIEAGISKSLVTKWRTNSVQDPSAEVARKVANYFGITVAELLEEGNEKKPLVNGDEELTEYLEILKTRPEMRMLFHLSKDATKEDVEAAVRIIEALRNK